jgi:ribosomal protein L7/L12
MINVGMTIREMVSIASNPSCNGDLYDRIIKALEMATGNEMLLVGCNGVVFNGNFWDSKIAAIKSLRLATGMGLKDAKDWIEEVQFHTKTIYTKPLEPTVAHKLCEELGKCGCSCWTTNA